MRFVVKQRLLYTVGLTQLIFQKLLLKCVLIFINVHEIDKTIIDAMRGMFLLINVCFSLAAVFTTSIIYVS